MIGIQQFCMVLNLMPDEELNIVYGYKVLMSGLQATEHIKKVQKIT